MGKPLRLEFREFDWQDVLAAYLNDEVEGITFLLRKPPYVGFVSTDDADYPQLLATLEGREQLLAPTEAFLAFRRFMSDLLDKALESLFEDPEAAREILDAAGNDGRPFHPRVALACVELSGGDLEELKYWCKEARMDYRDVYMAAWYG